MIIGQLELIMLAHVLDWLPAMTIFTFGPSITYRTSANPFQTPGPSPTEFGPGHSNMLAQTILKSWLTHYFQSWPTHYFNLGWHIISNLGWRWLTCFLLAHPLLNSDWDIQYVGPDNTQISANTLFASYFKSRPRSGGTLLLGKCTTRLDRFKRAKWLNGLTFRLTTTTYNGWGIDFCRLHDGMCVLWRWRSWLVGKRMKRCWWEVTQTLEPRL